MMANADKALRGCLEEIVAKKKYDRPEIKVKAITSEGANYTSALFLATVVTKEEDDLELFAKVAIVGPKMREDMRVDNLFVTERFFYIQLSKIYHDIQEKFAVPEEERFAPPLFYGCNANYGEETIVLENLVAKGYRSYNRFNSIDWDHAASSVGVLAKFHALSFAYQRENPEEFADVVEKVKFRSPEETEEMKNIGMRLIGGNLQVLDDELKGKVGKFFEKEGLDSFVKYNNPLGRPVLVHGDYRPSNLLFKKEADGIRTIAVDYQTLRSGCPVTDLIYFIFMGSDAEFRATHYQQLVDLYYQELKKALKKLHFDPESTYSREEYDRDFKEMMPYALLLGVTVLPVVTVDAAQAPRLDGDATFDSFIVKPNELYAKRFRELVLDCIRYGVL